MDNYHKGYHMWWEVDCNNTKMTRFDKLLNWCHNATNLTVLWKDMVELKQVVKMATCHFLQNMFRVLFLRSEWSRLSCKTVRMGVSENGVHPKWQFWQEGTWWSTIKLGGFAQNFRQTPINRSYFHVNDTNTLMSSMLSWNATEMLRPGVRFCSTFSYSRFQVDPWAGNPWPVHHWILVSFQAPIPMGFSPWGVSSIFRHIHILGEYHAKIIWQKHGIY